MSATEAPRRRLDVRAGLRELGRALPEPMRGFSELHRAATADGALTAAHKELMALAISICEGCDDCVVVHLHEALRAGATSAQVHEAIAVAIMMGGGPATVYGAKALDALGQFQDTAAT